MRVYLVDGTYELFRCFHGAPRAVGADGHEVGAGRGMFATLCALVADPSVTHVAVAFDSVVSRAGSAKASSDEGLIGAQTPLAAAVVRALGITIWPAGRFQADELLASGARRFADEPAVEQVVLCTTDVDLFQCVRGERVVVLDRSRRRVTSEATVVERFGVPPALLADLFALVGDRSDGIAGVPGWGLRSAAALLAAYGALEQIPEDPAAWPAPVRGRDRLAAALHAGRREALHCRDLLRLRDDVPLHDELSDLAWRGADPAAVAEVVERLGDPTLTERISRWR